jgi:hypothetical protein
MVDLHHCRQHPEWQTSTAAATTRKWRSPSPPPPPRMSESLPPLLHYPYPERGIPTAAATTIQNKRISPIADAWHRSSTNILDGPHPGKDDTSDSPHPPGKVRAHAAVWMVRMMWPPMTASPAAPRRPEVKPKSSMRPPVLDKDTDTGGFTSSSSRPLSHHTQHQKRRESSVSLNFMSSQDNVREFIKTVSSKTATSMFLTEGSLYGK